MPSPMQLAQYLDQNLGETFAETLDMKAARVFSISTVDGQLTHALVDTDPDPYRILTRIPKIGNPIDGLVLVMTGWMSKVADIDEDGNEIESDDDDEIVERIRVRVIAGVNDDGVSVVVRKFHSEDESDSFEDGGEGMFPEALKAWWSAIAAIQFANSMEEVLSITE